MYNIYNHNLFNYIKIYKNQFLYYYFKCLRESFELLSYAKDIFSLPIADSVSYFISKEFYLRIYSLNHMKQRYFIGRTW